MPAFDELIRQAAQGEVLHNDDTTVKILELMGRTRPARGAGPMPGGGTPTACPRSVHHPGGIATCVDRRVALFFSGRRHAGRTWRRSSNTALEELPPPIQMCDALVAQPAGQLQTILAAAWPHRRRFVDVYDRFPEVCRHLLESLAVVYRNDAEARGNVGYRRRRLQLHQEASEADDAGGTIGWSSGNLMRNTRRTQFEQWRHVGYTLKHWEKLTLFLRQAGAPLDNNLCERALKKAILHRKNALFYKTQNGAKVGDLFMSLIYTCQLNEANPFDYLTELQQHPDALAACPEQWMPWNYRAALA